MIQTQIQWRRLGAITAVQSAITLTWVIYSLYLPGLLVQLGFAKELAATLLIIEHGLEAVIEPIFGAMSDRSQQKMGTRFPWISLGVILASAFLIALPIIVLFVPKSSAWRLIFPVTAVLWASAMAIFRSPAIALLTQVTPQAELPIASSCLNLVQQLIKVFRLSAYSVILSLGPLVTFAIGSLVILGSATFLRQVMPPASPQPQPTQPQSLPMISPPIVVMIVGTAIALGWGLRFFFAGLPQLFATQLPQTQVSSAVLAFNILLAFMALAAGKIASEIGNHRAMFAGLLSTAVLLGILLFNGSMILLAIGAILISFTFSIVLNGMVPLVLDLVPVERSGLGTGIYFGAFGAAISFFDLVFAGFSTLGLQVSCAAIAMLVASILVVIGYQNTSNRQRLVN
jgi:Na+/melibiose symporter-like transporter